MNVLWCAGDGCVVGFDMVFAGHGCVLWFDMVFVPMQGERRVGTCSWSWKWSAARKVPQRSANCTVGQCTKWTESPTAAPRPIPRRGVLCAEPWGLGEIVASIVSFVRRNQGCAEPRTAFGSITSGKASLWMRIGISGSVTHDR